MTELPEPTAILHTDRYTSSERFEREGQAIFGKTWIAVARESDVANEGDCLSVDELGESVLLVRGGDGSVRAFRNSCRHRGTRLLDGRCRVAELRCPYHGWTYRLDGRLEHVPGASEFRKGDLRSRDLLPVRVDAFAGFVWLCFDEAAPPLREYLGDAGERLAPFRLEEMRPIYRRTSEHPCNWKAILDNNGERYHVSSLHPFWWKVLGPEVGTFHDLTDHQLRVWAMGDFRGRAALDRWMTPARLELNAEQSDLYHRFLIFPNTLLSATPYQLTVFRIFPITKDTCRFHYEFHVRHDASLLTRLRAWVTLAISLRIIGEDNSILGPFQKGVSAVGRQSIPLHSEEIALEHFHRVVDRYLGERPVMGGEAG